jgi:hypothetical protein
MIGLAHRTVLNGAFTPVMFAGESAVNMTLRPDDLQALAVSPYTHWRAITAPAKATDIGASMVGTAEHVWLISTEPESAGSANFKAHKWNESSGAFAVASPPASGVRIDVKGSEPWLITVAGLARSFTGGAWVDRGDCNFVDIGASAGAVWALGTPSSGGNFTVHRFTGNSTSTGTGCLTLWRQLDGKARYIDVEPSGSPWVVTNGGDIFHRNGVTTTNLDGDEFDWSLYTGLAKDIAIGPEKWGTFSSLWITGHPSQTNEVFALNIQAPSGNGSESGGNAPERNGWYPAFDGGASFLTVGARSMPWVISSDGTTWRRRP